MTEQSPPQVPTAEQLLQSAVDSATELETLLSVLSSHRADQLEEDTVSQDYLELLANVMYSLNCVTYSYGHIKGLQVPQQFECVKEYYTKVKQAISNINNPNANNTSNNTNTNVNNNNNNSKLGSKINKQAVSRIIKHYT